MYQELLRAQFLYTKAGFEISDYNASDENREYSACSFLLNDKRIIFRASKITPTKNGQFVTVWKRNEHRITCPFHEQDSLDFIVIASSRNNEHGQFIFSKQVLIEKGIIESNGKPGKRGMRVYPPWDKAQSNQAAKTQQWQLQYFIEFNVNRIDVQRMNDLLK